MTRNIAVYGKGAIGKSTTASNISAALSEEGYRVMQIGCYPKSDFTNTLREGKFIPTVLDTLCSGKRVEIDGIVHQGYNDILCARLNEVSSERIRPDTRTGNNNRQSTG